MSEPIENTEDGGDAAALDAVIADILSNKLSTFDLLRSTPGDYWGFVQRARLLLIVSQDPRVLTHLQSDMRQKMVEAGIDPDHDSISRNLESKDGARRFRKLVDDRARSSNARPSLLIGANFDACLDQYKTLLGHVEKLWSDACQLYTLGNFPLAAFISTRIRRMTR